MRESCIVCELWYMQVVVCGICSLWESRRTALAVSGVAVCGGRCVGLQCLGVAVGVGCNERGSQYVEGSSVLLLGL